MNYIKELKEIFKNETISLTEQIKHVTINFESEISALPEFTALERFVNDIPTRDNIKINISADSSDNFYLSKQSIKTEQDYKNFITEAMLGDFAEIYIEIEKEISEECLSVYCYDAFISDLTSLNHLKMLDTFALLLKGLERLTFVVFDKDCHFMTRTMTFTSIENISISVDNHRLDKLERCNNTSSLSDAKKYRLLPDDFKFVANTENNPLTTMFDKLCTVLALTYISTNTEIRNESIFFEIMGQRYVSSEVKIKEISDNKELFKIYDWVYTDGNSVDKAILARNTLSLHCHFTGITNIDGSVFASIQSNYNLYLKNNIEHYLELKNKVTEYIQEFISKTGDYSLLIFDKFKQNLIAIVGFILTTAITNIVSDTPLDNIFTKDVVTLLELLLFGSILFFIASFIETNYRIKKVYSSYDDMKENYKHILSDDDIKEIFNDDSSFINMKAEIKRKRIIFSILWILLIIITLIILELNSDFTTIIDQFLSFVNKLSTCLISKISYMLNT